MLDTEMMMMKTRRRNPGPPFSSFTAELVWVCFWLFLVFVFLVFVPETSEARSYRSEGYGARYPGYYDDMEYLQRQRNRYIREQMRREKRLERLERWRQEDSAREFLRRRDDELQAPWMYP